MVAHSTCFLWLDFDKGIMSLVEGDSMVERDHVKVISYKLDRLKKTDVCDS